MTTELGQDCGIDIIVSTRYLQAQSDLIKGTYAFAYTVTIQNNRASSARLLNRHWIITDQNNHVEEVKGKGVVGQQPLIEPGQSFQYSSGTIIGSEVGEMYGSYTMECSLSGKFTAPIPLFMLAIPNMIH